MAKAMDYKKAGVDRERADRFSERIRTWVKNTPHSRVRSQIGGYASLYEFDKKHWLAATTDGVGTKLKLAFETGIHSTVGIDLVAMSVNDLICAGAEPQFFLDYFATGKLNDRVADSVLKGIIQGCREAQVALVGGETAEMPEFYAPGEYDLAGFAVGKVLRSRVLPRAKEVRLGDHVIGVASSGLHSNGFSLARKILPPKGAERSRLSKLCLKPTRIYVRATRRLILSDRVLGLAHITGSGFLNLPRISDQVSYEICLPKLAELAAIYRWLRPASGLGLKELASTFNLGIGLMIVCRPEQSGAVLKELERQGERAWGIGRVVARARGRRSEVFVQDAELGHATLVYA
jgi:phosphoribosylformylglycinamidine cyclo-ligase